jgi:hypothetical protein
VLRPLQKHSRHPKARPVWPPAAPPAARITCANQSRFVKKCGFETLADVPGAKIALPVDCRALANVATVFDSGREHFGLHEDARALFRRRVTN